MSNDYTPPKTSLEQLVDRGDYKVERVEQEHPSDAYVRRFKEIGLFLTALICIFIVITICIVIIFKFDKSSSGIAFNSLISIASALIGYYVRGAKF